MSDITSLIDFFVNAFLNVINHLRTGLGTWWYVWVATFFGFPYFRRLLRALKP